MRRSTRLLAAVCLLAASGCSKGDKNKNDQAGQAGESTAGKTVAAPEGGDKAAAAEGDQAAADPATLAKDVGVEPGPWQYDDKEGASAVLSSADGTVEVRRVGVETWAKAAANDTLHEGDQVRTDDAGKATVTLADQSVVELAEQSAVAIGSREATKDPASSAAVLYGVARFTVAPRAAGEGAFLVYTPDGVVATKGTVYTVGVVASGATRVGVESGQIEVAGSAKLDAPVPVASGKAVLIAPSGEVGAVQPVGDEDWGAWRDGAEAEVDPAEAAKYHTGEVASIEGDLGEAYGELDDQASQVDEAEAQAEAAQKANDPKAYEAAAPTIGAGVDASFALSLRLQYLTYALMSHAYVANALYVRHPDLAVVIDPARPRLAAAVLWHKKYHAVAATRIQPMRVYYYYHEPTGRLRAKAVAEPIPPFYARVKLKYKEPVLRGRVKFAVYRPPVIHPVASVHKKIWIGAPTVGWYAGVRAHVKPAPVKVAWYVRPKTPRAHVVFGAHASGRIHTMFAAVPPRPRVRAVIRVGGHGGVDVRDHRMGHGAAGIKAGASVRAGVATPAVDVRDHRRGAIRAGAAIKGTVGGAAVEVRDHRRKVEGAIKSGVGGAVGVGVGVHAGAGIKGGVNVRDHRSGGAAVQVRDHRHAPKPPVNVRDHRKKKPEVHAPSAKGAIKGSIKVKGGIKIGN